MNWTLWTLTELTLTIFAEWHVHVGGFLCRRRRVIRVFHAHNFSSKIVSVQIFQKFNILIDAWRHLHFTGNLFGLRSTETPQKSGTSRSVQLFFFVLIVRFSCSSLSSSRNVTTLLPFSHWRSKEADGVVWLLLIANALLVTLLICGADFTQRLTVHSPASWNLKIWHLLVGYLKLRFSDWSPPLLPCLWDLQLQFVK